MVEAKDKCLIPFNKSLLVIDNVNFKSFCVITNVEFFYNNIVQGSVKSMLEFMSGRDNRTSRRLLNKYYHQIIYQDKCFDERGECRYGSSTEDFGNDIESVAKWNIPGKFFERSKQLVEFFHWKKEWDEKKGREVVTRERENYKFVFTIYAFNEAVISYMKQKYRLVTEPLTSVTNYFVELNKEQGCTEEEYDEHISKWAKRLADEYGDKE